MTNPNFWLTLMAMGLITYGIRLSLILLLDRIGTPAAVQRALRLAPPAVLSAIILPEILRPAGAWDISSDNPRLLAGLLAAVVAWRTKNALLTIGVGLAALWMIQAVT